MKFENIFANSFDTFKVFAKLEIQQASLTNNNSPKSIWQILNHLIIWQDYQIERLCENNPKEINEVDTWFAEKNIVDQSILNNKIDKFEKQIEKIKMEVNKMTIEQNNISEKLKIVQDLTVHQSFHLGEIVLIMRQNSHYPMPNEMKNFLNVE
ncbi:hypothetical protein IA01_10815 [Flavobacterium psychrophilum]|uniref:DinB-like domain-containing protein n=2 Tax=Flavobacterium psychrophilum TaxID=96345 RepID=A6H1M2_FLAPJ|nr:hypothetical protein [Flavobacterium psychrophilum]AIG30918.1 hypothetical protein IA03_10800 [Flavobacterium psychrophilum]AIG33191.1 hypothetical protein IA01_10815 [Flavobacterium psychrophilum]AIG35344.1 hypothetical protein IA02_10190 [Flavobacterium psychrophilum]AIG37704.1 hypothetical protein IA04_10675 [Flavobacterium psychrophilum]AIG39976.1 hypothetical protein IA05_10800 [Flavobacterium psychrophilum]